METVSKFESSKAVYSTFEIRGFPARNVDYGVEVDIDGDSYFLCRTSQRDIQAGFQFVIRHSDKYGARFTRDVARNGYAGVVPNWDEVVNAIVVGAKFGRCRQNYFFPITNVAN